MIKLYLTELNRDGVKSRTVAKVMLMNLIGPKVEIEHQIEQHRGVS